MWQEKTILFLIITLIYIQQQKTGRLSEGENKQQEVFQAFPHIMVGIVDVFLHCIDRDVELLCYLFIRFSVEAGGIHAARSIRQIVEYLVDRLVDFGFYDLDRKSVV